MGKTDEALYSAKDLLLFWKKNSASVIWQTEVSANHHNGTTIRGPSSTFNAKRMAPSEHLTTTSSVKYSTLTAGTTVDDLAALR